MRSVSTVALALWCCYICCAVLALLPAAVAFPLGTWQTLSLSAGETVPVTVAASDVQQVRIVLRRHCGSSCPVLHVQSTSPLAEPVYLDISQDALVFTVSKSAADPTVSFDFRVAAQNESLDLLATSADGSQSHARPVIIALMTLTAVGVLVIGGAFVVQYVQKRRKYHGADAIDLQQSLLSGTAADEEP